MTTTTYWIARNNLVAREPYWPEEIECYVYSKPPAWHPDKGSWESDPMRADGAFDAPHWRAVGLPKRPAPGDCWEVRWETLDVVTCEEPGRERVKALAVPIARDVTAELKEAKS